MAQAQEKWQQLPRDANHGHYYDHDASYFAAIPEPSDQLSEVHTPLRAHAVRVAGTSIA